MCKFSKMYLIKIIVWFLLFELIEILAVREVPTITIPNQGMIIGVYLKMFRIQRVIAYLGIPFAQPPIGQLRFSPPVIDNLGWEGLRNGTILQPDCIQFNRKTQQKHDEAFLSLLTSNRGSTEDTNNRQVDEDCLYLNIYKPDGIPPTDGWSVIVWLHSGDFNYGSPSDLDPFQLVIKQKVIIVTIAYRLNIFGFFTTMDSEAPGNSALKDQSAALLWISNNIKLFGGNEMSITLMGHGSGAVSAGFHLTSGAWSSDYFHKAIIMSGSSMFDSSVREAKSYSLSIDKLAQQFSCPRKPSDKLLECLRDIPAQELVDGDPAQDWGPIIDQGLSESEAFIADFPRNLVEKGNLKKASLLLGFTDMEEVLDMPMGNIMEEGVNDEMYQTLIEDMVLNDLSQMEVNESCGNNNKLALDAVNFVYKPYPPVANAMELREKYIDFHTERKYAAPTIHLATHMSKKEDTTTYVYRFDIKPRTQAATKGIPDWVTVPQRFDLIFVWGFPYWSMLPDGAAWDSMDKRVADIIMTLWANFAKFTNPSQVGVYIKWDPFTVQNPGVLIIDRSFNMSDSTNMHYQGLQFWNSYYPEILNMASQCCNVTSNGKDSLFSYYQTKNLIFILTILTLFISHVIHLST